MIEGYWRELLLAVCKPIYKLIVYLYDLFEVIGTAEVITNSTLSKLYNRIGMLLGIYMLFRILLSFIQLLINPDNISDKEKGVGNIIKKAILVVALLGITPTIFEKAIDIQNFIVGANGSSQNIIAKLVFPTKMVKSDSFGSVLSAEMFNTFYRYDEDASERDCTLIPKTENDSNELYNHIVNSRGDISPAKSCLDYKFGKDTYERYQISFTMNGVFAIIVGGVICWVLLTYTLSVGARVIQLAFLRIISPLAILGYLSPKKDGVFEKWLKMCGTTYVDLFIRMAIIYFVVFLIDAMLGNGTDAGIILYKQYNQMWIVKVVMILALLMFAKKAPDLLKELFPKGGAASLGFGLSSPKKLFDNMIGGKQIMNAGKRAYGAAAVGLLAARGNARKNFGKTWDAASDWIHATNAADRKKARKEFFKEGGRTVFGSASSVLGGAWRGVKTTNRSGRKTAVDNAVAAQQANYKLKDAGYGRFTKKRMSDTILRAPFSRDQYIEEIAAASDARISALQSQISEMAESNIEVKTFYADGKSITGSKVNPGKYLYVDSNGKQHTINRGELGIHNDVFDYADLNSKLGKEQGRNKAIHQKENEQKSKSDK